MDLNPNDYNGGALVATSIAFLVLTWFSVLLRGYVRIFITKSFQGDDWLMLIAQLIFTMSAVFIIIGCTTGLGRHNKAVPQRWEINALMWQALATATYIVDMMFIKLSIGVFLLRLAVQKRYRYTIWISMFVIAVWSTALFFWNIFQCSPVQAQWDYTIPNLQCVGSEQIVAAAYALSVMTILTDWLYALLPVPMVWKVKMTKQAKVTVIVILGLGVFASIATLIRLKFLADLNDTADILFAGTDAMVWTLIEPGVAIVASSLVTIRPLLRQMRLKGFESTERSKSKSKRSAGRSAGGFGGSGHNNLTFGSAKDPQRSIPGHSPGDLTLIDLETGGEDSDPLTPGGKMPMPLKGIPEEHVTRIAIPRPPNAGNNPPETRTRQGSADGAPQPTPLSEVFVIEGPRRHSHLPGRPGSTNPLAAHPPHGHGRNKSLPLMEAAASARTISSRGSEEEYAERLETHSQSDGRAASAPPIPPNGAQPQGDGSGDANITTRTTLANRLSSRFSLGQQMSPRLQFLREGGIPPIYSKFMGYRRTE